MTVVLEKRGKLVEQWGRILNQWGRVEGWWGKGLIWWEVCWDTEAGYRVNDTEDWTNEEQQCEWEVGYRFNEAGEWANEGVWRGTEAGWLNLWGRVMRQYSYTVRQGSEKMIQNSEAAKHPGVRRISGVPPISPANEREGLDRNSAVPS